MLWTGSVVDRHISHPPVSNTLGDGSGGDIECSDVVHSSLNVQPCDVARSKLFDNISGGLTIKNPAIRFAHLIKVLCPAIKLERGGWRLSCLSPPQCSVSINPNQSHCMFPAQIVTPAYPDPIVLAPCGRKRARGLPGLAKRPLFSVHMEGFIQRRKRRTKKRQSEPIRHRRVY